MATKKKIHHKRRLLSASRPKAINSCDTAKPSSQASRALIRKYHALGKQLTQAQSVNDNDRATSIQAEIQGLGGLSSYQRASIAGQSLERGGDTSKLLMRWLVPVMAASDSHNRIGKQTEDSAGPKLRLLEIGALKLDNACAKSGLFEMERIDLQSQYRGIKQQDFMERPKPSSEAALVKEGFDVISLSLVLNFVPDMAARGAMLKRVAKFLRPNRKDYKVNDAQHRLFPSLFLVLPAPCVLNSRYMDEERLEAIMKGLGYALVNRKVSSKLASSLWRYEGRQEATSASFRKEQIRRGSGRNNFAITLR